MTRRRRLSPRQLAELHREGRSDPVLAAMLREAITLDRETYLVMNWGPDLEEPLPAELEAEVPRFFRRC